MDMRMNNEISRRGFARQIGTVLAGTALSGTASQAQGGITAAQVVDRIKSQLAKEGVIWRPSVYDGFHLGDPDTPVTGIVTTFQPTFRILRKASAVQKNFVISHESSYWDGHDPIAVVQNDPVYKAKTQFGAQNKMVVWRIHDHWHRKRPDPIFMGLARKLDWLSYYTPEKKFYEIPEMSLEAMGRYMQRRLGTQNVYVVGDPNLKVKTIGCGSHILSSLLTTLRTCDVGITGETPQHDTFEYVRDAVSHGQKKGFVMLSHEGLEEWGMEDFAGWLKPLVPELPVEWISTGDPFQIPPLHKA
jgi:putative NIF3 family GTP cyclohydrolase 1 type 2